MIYSKKHNFLFLKGVKVAGTSVEIALSNICGNKDIITPIANIDERIRAESCIRHAQNYGPKKSEIKDFINWLLQVSSEEITTRKAPKGIVNNHMPLKRIYKKLDQLHPEIKDAKIFAVIRSPYQQILSHVNHIINFKGYRTSGDAMEADQRNLKEALNKYTAQLLRRNPESYRSKNLQIYDSSFDQSIRIEYLRFENLKSDLDEALKKIGVKRKVKLPFTKKGLQSSNDLLKEIASTEQINIINNYHKADFERFDYEMINPS